MLTAQPTLCRGGDSNAVSCVGAVSGRGLQPGPLGGEAVGELLAKQHVMINAEDFEEFKDKRTGIVTWVITHLPRPLP